MDDPEEWRVIEEFPEYSVSDQGRVISGYGGRILVQSLNQQKILSVGMLRDGKQCRRSVASLVASAFVPKPRYTYDTATPINLNGDRTDNRAVNLRWRPRWFAIKYHQQFKRPPYEFEKRIRIHETREIFYNAREIAVKYGMLEIDIVVDLNNQKGVWPQGYTFELL